MYLNHYNLKIRPFAISPDSRFLWLGEKHAEALATLRYGILESKGFLLVTGDVGTGKTALINQLIETLEIKVISATIPDPGLDIPDFFKILAVEFNINTEFHSKGEFLIQFKNFLLKANEKKSKVLLIIDEAQRLNHELLEQIRLLSNIEMHNNNPLNIFFVGQPEIIDILKEERNRAVRQRIALKYSIAPLTEKETYQYIKHRLKIAGSTYDVFTTEAIHDIFSITNGYPRLINIICDHALLSGYVMGINLIDRTVIQECKRELNISISLNIKATDDYNKQENASIVEECKRPFYELKTSTGYKSMARIISLLMIVSVISIGAYFLYPLVAASKYAQSLNEYASKISTRLLQKKIGDSSDSIDEADKKEIASITSIANFTDHLNRKKNQYSTEAFQKKEGNISTKFDDRFGPGPNFYRDLQIRQAQLNTSVELTAKTTGDPIIEPRTDSKTPDNFVREKNPLSRQNAKTDKTKAKLQNKKEAFQSNNTTINNLNSHILKNVYSDEKNSKLNTLNTISAQTYNSNVIRVQAQFPSISGEQKVVIYFSSDSTGLTDDAIEKLEKVREFLLRYSAEKLIIEGYGDLGKNNRYNEILSKLRATIVKHYLVRKGIVKSRMEVFWKGFQNPAAYNAPLEKLVKNHQVEIKLK